MLTEYQVSASEFVYVDPELVRAIKTEHLNSESEFRVTLYGDNGLIVAFNTYRDAYGLGTLLNHLAMHQYGLKRITVARPDGETEVVHNVSWRH